MGITKTSGYRHKAYTYLKILVTAWDNCGLHDNGENSKIDFFQVFHFNCIFLIKNFHKNLIF